MSFFGSMVGMSSAGAVVQGAADVTRTLNTAKNLREETESANSNATIASEAAQSTSDTETVASMGADNARAGQKQTDIYSNAVL